MRSLHARLSLRLAGWSGRAHDQETARRPPAPAGGCPGDQQDRVVAGDGAEDRRPARPGRSPMRSTGPPPAGFAARPGWPTPRPRPAPRRTAGPAGPRRTANSPACGRAVAALAGHGVDKVPAELADPERADLDQVAGQGALGDDDWPRRRAGRPARLGPTGGAEQSDDPGLPGRLVSGPAG